MAEATSWIEAERRGGRLVLRVGGPWLVNEVASLDRKLQALEAGEIAEVEIDGGAIDALDSVGAWLLLRTRRHFSERGLEVTIEALAPQFQALLAQVEKRRVGSPPSLIRRHSTVIDALALIGMNTIDLVMRGIEFLGFFGFFCVTLVGSWRHPGRIRMTALVVQMERTGVSAVPIVGLLSFLIGAVFAYQGADQLRRFGADIYAVNLLAVSVLRELGVILAAIIVAGRSGSAFTAEIGTMQVNEEIDAMRTLGLDPMEVLVLPRLFGLILTLPLLTFFANFMGLIGGGLVFWGLFDVPPPLFLQQLRGAVQGWTFWLGPVKAPFFAIAIALIGCHEGLRVSRSAESVGRLTTLSVVESIFLVIVIDAIFSLIFARLDV